MHSVFRGLGFVSRIGTNVVHVGAGLGSIAYSFFTIPVLTGTWKGALGSVMIGSGTTTVTLLHSLAGGLVGYVGGGIVGGAIGLVGAAFSKQNAEAVIADCAKTGAALGGGVCLLGGSLIGIQKGYDLTTDIVTQGFEPRTAQLAKPFQYAADPSTPAIQTVEFTQRQQPEPVQKAF